MDKFHRVLYRAGLRTLWCGAQLARPFSRKLDAFFRGRRGSVDRVRAWRAAVPADPLWFHCSSSGELEQLLPVLEALRAAEPNLPIFLTVFSPSGWRALELERQRRAHWGLPIPWSGAEWLPVDFARNVREFVTVLRPRAFYTIHRELWPVLADALRHRKVPQAVLSCFVGVRPPRVRGTAWERLAWAAVVDGPSQARLHAVLPNLPAEPLGDPRLERIWQRRERNRATPSVKTGPVLVLASVWPADVRFVRTGVLALLAQDPRWNIVWVPHEPSEKRCRSILEDFPLHRISREALDLRKRGWLYDRIGGLAELYAVADLVFVGGSARGRVHNVLEPAAYAVPILTGPRIENSRDALELQGRGLHRCPSSQVFTENLLALAKDEARRQADGGRAQRYLLAGRGTANRYAEKIIRELDL